MTSKKSDSRKTKTASKEMLKTGEVEEKIRKAYLPAELSNKYHPFYEGKIEIIPRVPVRTFDDFAIWYTPGVAEPCKKIAAERSAAYKLTNKWNNVAIVTDGSRVLGLGDIGPEAGLPVMEGKSLLFKYLGGVDAFPVCLGTKDPDSIVQAVLWLQPSFGGVNLEDIAQPKCFYILDRLRKEAEIPVWHDDQQGTATIVVAGAINAVKIIGKKMRDITIAMIGAGASNIRIAKLMIAAGVNKKNIIMVDSKGILNAQRKDIEMRRNEFSEKWEMCIESNLEQRDGGIAEAMKGVDFVIAASKPGPGVIRDEWVKDMANDAIVFAIANPVPEIWPWEAKNAGAKIVATGRSDFPNQVNNSLGFPGIFRGTLDVRANTITDGMCLAAAKELARIAEDRGMSEDYIVPLMNDYEVFPREAAAVAEKAIEEGIARVKRSRSEILKRAAEIIARARNEANFLMERGFIRPPPS